MLHANERVIAPHSFGDGGMLNNEGGGGLIY